MMVVVTVGGLAAASLRALLDDGFGLLDEFGRLRGSSVDVHRSRRWWWRNVDDWSGSRRGARARSRWSPNLFAPLFEYISSR
jgi:hypothetical protein